MRIATWNVNSIRMRMPHIAQWVKEAQPDILLLQELKCETESFPRMEIEALGYQAHVSGQKSYNGVAILSRHDVQLTLDRLPGDDGDIHARYLEAQSGDFIVASIYLPNGNPVESEKFPYKLKWLERLEARARELLATERPVILGGDFNVIPTALDVYDPARWEGDALYRPESRAAWRRLKHLGLTDAFRALHPDEPHAYSFWDYQQGAWQNDLGIRIDHFLLSPEAADRLQGCHIDRAPRGWDKASDHTPVICHLSGDA
ncbi:MAG: exodeoxyribonuclease III [Alphaproteobacteria bacterium]